MNKLTANEQGYLDAIADSEYQRDTDNPTGAVWLTCIHGWSDTPKHGGTVASLLAKGLIRVQEGETAEDDTVQLTPEGVAAVLNARSSAPAILALPDEPLIVEGPDRNDLGHGSPHDRGAADSWYLRERNPHFYHKNTATSPKVTEANMSPEQIADYHRGYTENEESGCHKDW